MHKAPATAEAPIAIDAARADAAAAGLRYASDTMPGISRQRRRGGFAYRHPDNTPVDDAATLARIKALAIPPAYEAVWICRSANGHLQAVGRDARGRKQYRYHALWRSFRDAAKYDRLAVFANALPAIRQRVARDLALSGLPRERVLAAAVHLLEATLVRIGNVEYARGNGSFGLTTLLNRHLELDGAAMRFVFRGKHRIVHRIALRNRRLANILRQCRDLPGQPLFEYVGKDGEIHAVGSADVNAYLRDAAGEDVTAKDFRTWAGSRLAMEELAAIGAFSGVTEGRRNVVAAIRSVAVRLGNTPAVCRKCYIHPAVLDAYLQGGVPASLVPGQVDGLTAQEAALLHLLVTAGK